MRVALATCLELPDPDIDMAPTLRALTQAGHDAAAPAWDDDAVRWDRFDVVLLRSPWNYVWACEAFMAWVDRVSRMTRVLNSSALVRWNIHKRYLLELEAAGVLIVPTAVCDRGVAIDVRSIAESRGWEAVVVKPAIGAGSWRTRRFVRSDFDAAGAFATSIADDGDVLVQELRSEFESPGERAIVCIEGEPTHVAVKRPRYADDEEQVTLGTPATVEERALIDRVLGALPERTLYARVDVIPTDRGPMLSELEVIEPSLFFPLCEASLERFVKAVEAWGGGACE